MWHKAAEIDAFAARERIHKRIQDRYVTIIKSPDADEYYAMDSVCYHMGGPLGVGDIEELVTQDGNKHQTIICPWHYHRIDIKTGCKWNQSVQFDPDTKKPVPGEWQPMEHIQRTHSIEKRQDGFFISFASDSINKEEFKSDKVACKQNYGNAFLSTTATGAMSGSDGKMKRSGHLMNKVKMKWPRNIG